jgi:hypothetical protein
MFIIGHPLFYTNKDEKINATRVLQTSIQPPVVLPERGLKRK